MNFYDVMTRIAHTDAGTKQAVIDHLRPILLDWIGHADTLDHTSTYGIRRYYNGSRCVRAPRPSCLCVCVCVCALSEKRTRASIR